MPITQNIGSLGTPPTTSDPSTFASRADALLGTALPARVTEMNAWAVQANALAEEVNDNAETAGAAAIVAAAASEAAIATAGASLWSAATNYVTGAAAISPVDYQTYRRKSPGGVDASEPSADSSKWQLLGSPATMTGKTLVDCTLDGTNPVGYKNIPQNSQSTAYTAVLADAGKHLLHPSADTTARTFTIPANSSVAYPIGTALTFVNQNGAGAVTIAITSDTMRLAGAGTTGSRTLAANGVATAIKIAATEWIISGSGLT